MLYYVQTRQELDSLGLKLPKSVQKELLRSTAYPAECIALIAEDREDISEARSVIDYAIHPAEWVNRLDDGWLSALYVINNSFTVTLLLPADIAPDTILRELEE